MVLDMMSSNGHGVLLLANVSLLSHTMDIIARREIFTRIIAKNTNNCCCAYKHCRATIYLSTEYTKLLEKLHMFFQFQQRDIDPIAVEALDLLFILRRS